MLHDFTSCNSYTLDARDGRSAVLEVADREVVAFDEDGQDFQVVEDSNPIPSAIVESSDRDDAEQRRRIRLLGCWLFGSALRM